jgi:hypothetical protein
MHYVYEYHQVYDEAKVYIYQHDISLPLLATYTPPISTIFAKQPLATTLHQRHDPASGI